MRQIGFIHALTLLLVGFHLAGVGNIAAITVWLLTALCLVGDAAVVVLKVVTELADKGARDKALKSLLDSKRKGAPGCQPPASDRPLEGWPYGGNNAGN